jgi:hypothetical protein
LATLIGSDGEMLPRWWGIMRTLAEMTERDCEYFQQDEEFGPEEFAQQLRAMLKQNKWTRRFHWSVTRKGDIITATKGKPWKRRFR